MKRHFSFFRIKVILITAIIVFPTVFIIMLGSLLARSGNHSNTYLEPFISIKNAPEGTAYLDILVKMKPSSDEYVDFAEWEMPPKIIIGWNEEPDVWTDLSGKERNEIKYEPIWKELNITPDSEIAQFNDDGYVSLSAHLKGCRGFYYYALSNKEVDNRLVLDERRGERDLTELLGRYGKFKAAYVGENGEVLGVTGKSAVRHDHFDPCEFSANGNKLTLTIFGDPAWKVVLLLVSFFGEPVAIVLLIVCIVLDKLQKPKPYLPPRPNSMPRSIEERNKDNNE